VLFEKEQQPGGRLRIEPDQEELPESVLDAEIQQILKVGIELEAGSAVTQLDEMVDQFDAVLLSCGHVESDAIQAWKLDSTQRGVKIDKNTWLTNRSGVFAAGSLIRRKSLFVRSVADGKLAARAIHEYVSGQPITPPEQPFSSRISSIQTVEAEQLANQAGHLARFVPETGHEFSEDQAAAQSDRCFSCGCVSHGSCKLETYAVQYGADPRRFAGERKPLEVIERPGGIRFESHKCIKCELCIQIADRAGEPLGLTFVGRGFDVQVAVPFDGSLDEALSKTAADCVAACPTGALAWQQRDRTAPLGQ
jgi:ferredoxin